MKKVKVAQFSQLKPQIPAAALVANVDLVLIRYDSRVSVLYGRCPHRGAMLADGCIKGENLICGLHGWDFLYKSGISEYRNSERLMQFKSWVEEDQVLVDEEEIGNWERQNPQPYRREQYLGQYDDIHGTQLEPHVKAIQNLARHGLNRSGPHGVTASMGVERNKLPRWDDLQLQTAQLAHLPLFEDAAVDTGLTIGPQASRPLKLEIPILVSDMSFGALSEEAKLALSAGAELSGTAICSGEGGMLPEEQQASSRYIYELASAGFGFSMQNVERVQAFHFKAGQAAKTGIGGHLPGTKVKGKIAAVRGLKEGVTAISPPRFRQFETAADFRKFGDEIRERTGGIPIGFKISANHIEESIDFALKAGCDYVILDGRGGATGSAPLIFRDNISIPTIPALARARKHLDKVKSRQVTLIITGGLRVASDFIKALCLGADGIAVSNAALQAIGCIGMRACHTDNCPVGITTQKPHLRRRLEVEKSARQLANFFSASVHLMQVISRACGYDSFAKFNKRDLVTVNRDMAYLSGVEYAGLLPL